MSTDLVVVPHTGEAIDLHASDDTLVPLVLELAQRERELRDARQRIEATLIDRMQHAEQRTRLTPAGHILDLRSGRRRVWDAEDLEEVVRHLIDQGTVTAGSLTGLIRRESIVNGTIALRLLNQLDRGARAQVEACYRWQDGTPKLAIAGPNPPAIDATAEDDT